MKYFIEFNSLGIFSLIILAFLFFQAKSHYKNKENTYKKLWFSCIVLAFIVQVLDIVTWSLVGVQGTLTLILSYGIYCLGYLFISLLSTALALFVEYNINFSEEKYRLLKKAFLAPIIINLLLSVFSIKFGFFFKFDDFNNYTRGDFLFVSIILSYSPLIFVIFRTLFMHRKESLRLRGTLLGGLLFPLFFNILQVSNIVPIPILFPSVTLSILFFYMFLINNSIFTDYLTGLQNKRGINKYFDDLPSALDEFLCVIYMDINDFKKINDNYGHEEGDQAIISFSKALIKTVSKSDLAARIGGDEFLIVAMINDEKESKSIVEKINKELEEINSIKKDKYSLSMSYGICSLSPQMKIDREKLISKADEVMYLQKNKKKYC